MVIGRGVISQLQKLKRYSNTDDGVILFVHKHVRISTERSRTFGDGMWSKHANSVLTFAAFCIRIGAAARSTILDLQQQRSVFTRYLDSCVATKSVATHVAQSLGDDLKQLCRQTIVDIHFAVSLYFDLDPRDEGKPFGKSFNRGQQNVHPFFIRLESPNKSSQLSEFVIRQFEQFLYVCADPGVTRFMLF